MVDSTRLAPESEVRHITRRILTLLRMPGQSQDSAPKYAGCGPRSRTIGWPQRADPYNAALAPDFWITSPGVPGTQPAVESTI